MPGSCICRWTIALALARKQSDIELERFLPKISDTDLLRARGGGLLRGLGLLRTNRRRESQRPGTSRVDEPHGGSTPTPLVNTNFSDIADQPAAEQSVGHRIDPDVERPCDSAIRPGHQAASNFQHVSTLESSTVLSGSTWLAQKEINAN